MFNTNKVGKHIIPAFTSIVSSVDRVVKLTLYDSGSNNGGILLKIILFVFFNFPDVSKLFFLFTGVWVCGVRAVEPCGPGRREGIVQVETFETWA